ncbi:hypothetical protein LTR17_016450 [Elasticomyces elasticus]|nr:hypothetical protein LTR17_016450 [Elasticomyces elasticus]
MASPWANIYDEDDQMPADDQQDEFWKQFDVINERIRDCTIRLLLGLLSLLVVEIMMDIFMALRGEWRGETDWVRQTWARLSEESVLVIVALEW